MSLLEIRSARLDEIPRLRQLEQLVIQAERPHDALLKPDPIQYYDLEALILSPLAELAVGILDGVLVATGYAKILPNKEFYQDERHGYLGFMCVIPQYRGRGYNAQILNYLFAWARSQKIQDIRLEVYEQNFPAVRAYEKLGFTKSLVEMRYVLE
jgi:ribosomal protein S18 acetylase RimI-like enzyme